MTEKDKLYADKLRNKALSDYERLDHAINELERQTCDTPRNNLETTSQDCIIREEAIRIAEQGQIQGYEWQFKELCNLPSVTPSYNSIKTELKPCEDCISRQAAINAITKIHPIDAEYDCTLYDKLDVMCVLKDLPAVSIDPKQKDGMWIMDYRGRMKQCSECGVRFDTWSNELLYDNYCPRCGIPMKNDDITLEEEKNETNN